MSIIHLKLVLLKFSVIKKRLLFCHAHTSCAPTVTVCMKVFICKYYKINLVVLLEIINPTSAIDITRTQYLPSQKHWLDYQAHCTSTLPLPQNKIEIRTKIAGAGGDKVRREALMNLNIHIYIIQDHKHITVEVPPHCSQRIIKTTEKWRE